MLKKWQAAAPKKYVLPSAPVTNQGHQTAKVINFRRRNASPVCVMVTISNEDPRVPAAKVEILLRD